MSIDQKQHDASADIRRVLSPTRMSTYDEAARPHQSNDGSDIALTLYGWNAAISGAMLCPIQLCEVTIRNAVSDILTQMHGADWA